jgi:hypothetical protein
MDIPVYIYFIALSFLASVVTNLRQQPDQLYLKLFPFYLAITFIIESVGVYRWSNHLNTANLYSFFGVFEFMYYFFVLHQVLNGKKAKSVVTAVMITYPLLFLTNILFIQIAGFHSITYSLGCLVVVALCIYYFYELFQSQHSITLIREPAFWICTGLLFFYCCTFPYFALTNFMINFPSIIMNNFQTLMTLMNSLLYSLFTIAFLCRIRIRRSMSSY